MKKAITLALTATFAATTFMTTFASAQTEGELISEKIEETASFMQVKGKLGKIEKRENGVVFTSIEQGDHIFSLTITDKTVVLDNAGQPAELQEGQPFTAFIDKNKPMLMIYPPQYTPEVLVVESNETGMVKLDTFNEEFVNESNTLKLNVTEESHITNLAGEKVTKEAIIGKEVLVFYGPATYSIPAQTNPYHIVVLETEEEIVKELKPFTQHTGEISDMMMKADNNAQVVVTDEKENTFTLAIDTDTIVMDNTGKEVTLEKGMKVTAYMNSNKPMILIYPPQYAPEVVIVETEEVAFVDVSTYDDSLTNKENTLKLTITEETVITNTSGITLTKEDISGKKLVVFYTTSTRSIPAQAVPSKIIVLSNENTGDEIAILDVISEIIQHDSYDINGVKMVPLRLLAENLNFTVKSTGQGAILTKGDVSIEITREKKEYQQNDALKMFEMAPTLLEENKTYVPVSFIYSLKNVD